MNGISFRGKRRAMKVMAKSIATPKVARHLSAETSTWSAVEAYVASQPRAGSISLGGSSRFRGKQEKAMYVAIRSYEAVKFPDEAAAKVRNEFLPIVSKIPGFQEYYAVRTGDSTVASISIFKDKPGADESVRAARTWIQKNMTRYLPNPPKVLSGETIAHMAPKARKSAA